MFPLLKLICKIVSIDCQLSFGVRHDWRWTERSWVDSEWWRLERAEMGFVINSPCYFFFFCFTSKAGDYQMSWTGAALFQQDLYSLWLKRWRPHKRYTRPIYISSSIGSKTIWREIFSFILFNLHANLLSKLTFFFFFFEYIYIYRRDFPWTAVLFRWEIIITYYTYIERGKRIIDIRHPHKPLWMMRRNSYIDKVERVKRNIWISNQFPNIIEGNIYI
jgi:hypothetical protein